MNYACGHCGRAVFECNTLISLQTSCQYCDALNIFHFSPIAIGHRPPFGNPPCTDETCNSCNSSQPPVDLSRLLEPSGQSEARGMGNCTAHK
jgi:hypothetical protein